ncbi:MAG: hypothetical protein IPK20_12810 [Betaproteobacteria bacterium]|nr:hypothetical protein [Betaproteobacteria bacterium]
MLLPTTATAFCSPVDSVPRPVPAETDSATTAIIPAGVAGKAASRPPKVGQCLTTA